MKLMKPVLSAEAGQLLAEEFSNLRAMDAERGMGRANALTAWVMETMIRFRGPSRQFFGQISAQNLSKIPHV